MQHRTVIPLKRKNKQVKSNYCLSLLHGSSYQVTVQGEAIQTKPNTLTELKGQRLEFRGATVV